MSQNSQQTVTLTEKPMPTLVEQLMEAVFVGRTMRDGDKAFIREVLRLQHVNGEFSKGLQSVIGACRTTDYRDPLSHAAISTIARETLAKAGAA